MIKAGFSERDISPAAGMQFPGHYFPQFNPGIVHDPLKARVCVLDNEEQQLAIIGVDTTGMERRTVLAIRQGIAERCGIAGEAILIAASHTHGRSGPLLGFIPDEWADAPAEIRKLTLEESPIVEPGYEEFVVSQTVSAAVQAWTERRTVRLSVGSGEEDGAVFSRVYRLKNGRTSTNPGRGNPEIVEAVGGLDPEVGVVAAWREDGSLLGCVVNYACHPTTFGSAISADWIYEMEETIQGVMGKGAKVVFLNGACANITQNDHLSCELPDTSFARLVGVRVGAEVLKTLVSLHRGDDFLLAAKTEILEIPRRVPAPESVREARKLIRDSEPNKHGAEYIFAKERIILDYLLQKSPNSEVEIQAMQIGPLMLLVHPAQVFGCTGLEMKRRSSFPTTFMVGIANGYAGYVPPLEFMNPESGGGYETVLTARSCLVPEAADLLTERLQILAGKFAPGDRPKGKMVEPSQRLWGLGQRGPDLD